jgi:hypothetical protein
MKLSKVVQYSLGVVIIGIICMSGSVSAAEKKRTRAYKSKLIEKTVKALPVTVPVEKSADKVEVSVPEKILHDADALISGGKAAEAYVLLSPLDFDYSGNARFDYLLGISALDSGHADKATLAFERVLAVDPNFAGARLDMARAYFHLGDLARAKTEFEAVMKQDPPPAARTTIAKYLAAIDAAEEAKNTHYSAYVEGAFGRDSNVNNSTSESQIPIPAFGNLVFTLNPTSVKTPGSYYTTATGGEMSRNFSDQWGMYGGLDYRRRANENSVSAFDFSNIDVRSGITFEDGDDFFRAGGVFSQFALAHIRNRDTVALTGDWRHNFSPRNQLSFFAQYSQNNFWDSALQINDFFQSVVGSSFLHMLGDSGALFGSLNRTSERAVYDRADGNKAGYGLRIGAQTTLGGSVEVSASAGYQLGNYDKENVAFLSTRNDRLSDVSFGGNWHWDKFWTVRPMVSYSKNSSSIPIYGFDRLDASITVRRDFK